MTQQVMVDLETMGNGNYAAIVSIGAVKFDPLKRADTDETFHMGIDLASSMKFGLRTDASTIEWWMDADRDAARRELQALPKVGLDDALDGFRQWFGMESLPTWGNGATFDNVILRNAFTLTNVRCPWGFWHDRCFRTLKNCVIVTEPKRMNLTQHNALDDAIHQTEWLRKIMGSWALPR